MSAYYPSYNDRDWDLLKKLVLNTAQIAQGGGGGGGGVTSISGTANQVVASASTGAITLSLPTSVAGVNSITAATNQTLTLATLDNNKPIIAAPHGTGNFRVQGAGGYLWASFTSGNGYIADSTNVGLIFNYGGGIVPITGGTILGHPGSPWGNITSNGTLVTGAPTGGSGAVKFGKLSGNSWTVSIDGVEKTVTVS